MATARRPLRRREHRVCPVLPPGRRLHAAAVRDARGRRTGAQRVERAGGTRLTVAALTDDRAHPGHLVDRARPRERRRRRARAVCGRNGEARRDRLMTGGAYSSAAVRWRAAHGPSIACVACAALLLGVAGCGGSTSHAGTTSTNRAGSASTAPATTTSSAAASDRAVWASRAQQLCREKGAAIARLGNIHITYGGIRRVGLPAVKRILDRYLVRLLAVLHGFSTRQQQLTAPAVVSAAVARAAAIDRRSQEATTRLRVDIARAGTPAAFAAAFRVWIATTARLAAQGDALARQLDLPACRSGAGAVSN
jgi:hypothetical protein